MQQAGYHHAYHLASQLCEDIQKRDTELLPVIQSAIETSSIPPLIAPSDISTVTTPVQQQINAVQSDPVQLGILKLLQQMQQSMTTTTTQTNNNNNTGQQNRRCPPCKTPDNVLFSRKQAIREVELNDRCGLYSSNDSGCNCCVRTRVH